MTNDKDSAMRMASFLADIENSTLEELRQRCSSQMDRINDQASEINRLRQPTQSDALAPIGTEGKYVHDDLELSCRVTAHIEGWLEVEFLHNTDTPYYPVDRSSAIIRPSRFIPLQEQSPFAQLIPSLHIHLQKTQINRPSNLHKTQIAKPERPDMTDTVLRQAVIDAIEALSPDGLKPKGVGLVANITIKKALAAINVIPAVDEWRDIKDAPRNGTVFLAIRPTGAGHPSYMLPYVMRHEGRLYSTFQYNNGSLWVDWPKPDPTLWKPIDMPSLVAAFGE
jgi:hypothetical protein